MGIDHRSAHVLVSEQFLDRSDIVSRLEQMRGERMPQGVARGPPVQTGPDNPTTEFRRIGSTQLVLDKPARVQQQTDGVEAARRHAPSRIRLHLGGEEPHMVRRILHFDLDFETSIRP